MAVKGRLWGAKYGPDDVMTDGAIGISGMTNVALATLNNGYSARFKAVTTKDIYSVRFVWQTVTAAGQITIRIETDTAGKPSGSLYDANAVLTAVVPVAGTQTYTFSTPPSTGLVIDAMYHVVILTTTGGTAHTLRAYVAQSDGSNYPIIALTAADGTTRTNFAEQANSVPLCSLVLSDSTEDSMGMMPYGNVINTINLITSGGNVVVAGLKFVTDVTLSVTGVEFVITKAGTPTANLRIRIYDSTNTLVTNSTISVSASALTTGAASRRSQFFGFAGGAVITLTPGTYRCVFDGAADTTSANCWKMIGATPFNAASVPSGFSMTTAPNIASPSWTDTTDQVPVRLILDDVTAPAATSVAPLFNAGVVA